MFILPLVKWYSASFKLDSKIYHTAQRVKHFVLRVSMMLETGQETCNVSGETINRINSEKMFAFHQDGRQFFLCCYEDECLLFVMFLISWQMIAMLFCSSVHDWKLVKWYTLDGSLHLTQEKQTCLWEKTLGYFLIQLSTYLFITVLQSVTSQNT